MRTGSVDCDTVKSWNGICSSIEDPSSGTMVSWKTSQGPAKSMTVAPSVTTKATRIGPLRSGFEASACVPSGAARSAPEARVRKMESAAADRWTMAAPFPSEVGWTIQRYE